MTKKLYHENQYLREFSSTVRQIIEAEERARVVLTETLFYPRSGGQPHDTGTLNDIPVLDVYQDASQQVVHLLAETLAGNRVEGRINWARRFDHMQQHTGQHILSQAFIQSAGAQTVGFHLSDETATIDLDQKQIDQEQLDEAEKLANEIVWQNRPVVVRWATRSEAEALPLRKIPANGDEKLRLIDILDFDIAQADLRYFHQCAGAGATDQQASAKCGTRVC